MSRIFIFLLFFIVFIQALNAAPYTWNGGAIGDYQQPSNWTPVRTTPNASDILTFDATTPVTVSNVPNQTINSIVISAGTSSIIFTSSIVGNVLTVTAATPLVYTTAGSVLSGDLLTIALNSAAAFTISSGTFGIAPNTGGKVIINSTLTLAGGTLDFDVTGTGGAIIGGTGSITYTSGTFNSVNASSITWGATTNYYHNVNGSAVSAIPAAIWIGGSRCTISGMGAGNSTITGFTNILFSNITWNCTGQTGNVDLDFSGLPVSINGALTIASTGIGAVRFSGATDITAGSFVQTGGILVLQSGGSTSTLYVTGNFAHSVGTIDFVEGASAGKATLNVKGNLDKTGSSIWSLTSTNTLSKMTLQFSGTGVPSVQAVTISGGSSLWNVPATAGTCSILNSNTDPSGVNITGLLKVFNRNSTDTATCTNEGKFAGTGYIIYGGSGAGAARYGLVYSGSVSQTATAGEFPIANGPLNLTINGSVVNFPATSFDRTIPGTLTMVKGALNINSTLPNTLLLSNTTLGSQLDYRGGFITGGILSRYFPTTGLPTSLPSNSALFPFGIGANNRSINILFSNTSLTSGTGGNIAVSHTAVIGQTAIGSPFPDNGVTLTKRSKSSWGISTGTFDLGTATTCSVTAQADNIGTIDNLPALRFTNAVSAFGTASTGGTVTAPIVRKDNMASISDISGTFYIGSDNTNSLDIIIFTWNGSVSTVWNLDANWTPSIGGAGYPSAATEIAIINSGPPRMPLMNSSTPLISLYQLTVGAGASLTMNGTSSLSVFDAVTFTGTATFASTSTFTYASSVNDQTILNLPYGTLGISGAATKDFTLSGGTTTVTGDFIVSGSAPYFGTTGTFVYAAGTAPTQRIAPTKYYNLTFTGNRGLNTIKLGNNIKNNIIDVANIFDMQATNYTANLDGNNIFNFSSADTVTAVPIPGFTYGAITNDGNGKRVFDPLGATNPAHVIYCKVITASSPLAAWGPSYTPYDKGSAHMNKITGSKVKLDRSGALFTDLPTFAFHDLEITGNLGNTLLYVRPGNIIRIAGIFSITATNFRDSATINTFDFNGTGNQTIPAFRSNTGTNTPAWKFSKLTVTGGGRTVTFGTGSNLDTTFISDVFTVPVPASFTPGTNGFVVTASNSVIDFIGSGDIPVLAPVAVGGSNYNHVVISGGGVRKLASGAGAAFDQIIGGNLSVNGSDAKTATLNIGDALNDRNLTVKGNLSLTGTSATAGLTSLIDFNSGSKNVQIKLAGDLSIAGTSQITTGSDYPRKGAVLFNGVSQQYSSTASPFKNGFVNFVVGDGVNTIPTTLTLNNNLDLLRSGVQPFGDSLNIASNGILNAGVKNITIGTDDLNTAPKDAAFNLNAGGTFITANTGAGVPAEFAIEGTAVDGTTGTILSGTKITKNYNAAANYVLNGATINPFPAAITTMNKLTIGANISLNRAIDVNGTLDMASFTLTQADNNLEFNGLTSTTGKIYADKNSSLTIKGSIDTAVGTLRFVIPNGNITGQFNLDKGITVPLNSDLIIDKTPLTGNFITGNAASILDIRVNTLTINGAVSGPGFLGGSDSSNLTIGGTATTVNFATGKQVLKDLTLVNSATATLGTALNITGGTAPGNEGTVSVTGTAQLFTVGNLTLKSNANGTSRVAPGAVSGGYIIGDVTVERYLFANRAWRFMAAPTFGQTIKQSWQENQVAGVNPGTGLGTIITSNKATWAADGYDFQTPGHSLLTYNVPLNGWEGVPNTNTQITALDSNKAYMLFSRGDRGVTPDPSAIPTPVLIRTKGNIFQGDLPTVPVTAGKYAAIGNNYASAIDFLNLGTSNIDQSFSVWDANTPAARNLGAWVTFSAATMPAWTPLPAGGSYSAPNTRIESGQAFMVHNSTASNGTVSILESSKKSGSKLVARPAGGSNIKQMLTTNLYNINDGTAKIGDANAVVFCSEYSNAIDKMDALKLNNFGENFGLAKDGQILVVDARQPVAETDTIFFAMKKIKQQPYRLEFVATNFDASLVGFLEDTYLHSTTVVNMTSTTSYDFSVTSDAASAVSNRFRIVFKSSAPLPVTFSSIAATEKTNGIAVEWNVENETNIASYDVERSVDGRHFTKMNNTIAKGQITGGSAAYNWLDVKAMSGDNFYRIRSISKDGKAEYSRIVKVALGKGKAGFTVYPNPVSDGMIGLQMKNMPAGVYTVRVLNGDGQLISKEIIKHAGGNGTQTITSAKQLISGTYQLEITGEDKNVNVLRLLVL